jgi:predicted MFS family arabinose efflux permease
MALGFALSPVQLLLQFVVVNMLNYVDRGVVAGVLPTLQTEFGLDSTQTGFLGSSFVISYMIFSLPFAQLAQRFSPFMLMGVGLAFWIGSALVAYFSVSYQMLLVARSQPNARYFSCKLPFLTLSSQAS